MPHSFDEMVEFDFDNVLEMMSWRRYSIFLCVIKNLDVHPLHFDRVVHSGIRCRVGDDWSFVECSCQLC